MEFNPLLSKQQTVSETRRPRAAGPRGSSVNPRNPPGSSSTPMGSRVLSRERTHEAATWTSTQGRARFVASEGGLPPPGPCCARLLPAPKGRDPGAADRGVFRAGPPSSAPPSICAPSGVSCGSATASSSRRLLRLRRLCTSAYGFVLCSARLSWIRWPANRRAEGARDGRIGSA